MHLIPLDKPQTFFQSRDLVAGVKESMAFGKGNLINHVHDQDTPTHGAGWATCLDLDLHSSGCFSMEILTLGSKFSC